MYALDFEYRSDNGPSLVGPFSTEDGAKRWLTEQKILDFRYTIRPLYVPEVP